MANLLGLQLCYYHLLRSLCIWLLVYGFCTFLLNQTAALTFNNLTLIGLFLKLQVPRDRWARVDLMHRTFSHTPTVYARGPVARSV